MSCESDFSNQGSETCSAEKYQTFTFLANKEQLLAGGPYRN